MKKPFAFQFTGIVLLLIIIAYLIISTIVFVSKHDLVKAKVTGARFIEVSDRDSTDWYSLDRKSFPKIS